MLTVRLSIDLEKKISFSKGVCSERTLRNEKTSTCPETLVELNYFVNGRSKKHLNTYVIACCYIFGGHTISAVPC